MTLRQIQNEYMSNIFFNSLIGKGTRKMLKPVQKCFWSTDIHRGYQKF